MEKKVSVTAGPGMCSMLFLVFLVLKLTQVIAWSWWWVTSPLWIPVVLVLGILVITVIVATMCG